MSAGAPVPASVLRGAKRLMPGAATHTTADLHETLGQSNESIALITRILLGPDLTGQLENSGQSPAAGGC